MISCTVSYKHPERRKKLPIRDLRSASVSALTPVLKRPRGALSTLRARPCPHQCRRHQDSGAGDWSRGQSFPLPSRATLSQERRSRQLTAAGNHGVTIAVKSPFNAQQ